MKVRFTAVSVLLLVLLVMAGQCFAGTYDTPVSTDTSSATAPTATSTASSSSSAATVAAPPKSGGSASSSAIAEPNKVPTR